MGEVNHFESDCPYVAYDYAMEGVITIKVYNT